jgi:sugar lactone lactonase YvrE
MLSRFAARLPKTLRSLASPPYHLAEGPVWSAERNVLSWIDIEEGLILSAPYDGALGPVTTIVVGELIGCAIPISGNRYLCGLESQLAIVYPDGRIERSGHLIPSGRRFNDGKIDPQGRLVIGSLRLGPVDHQQHFLRLERDGVITILDSDLNLSNGLAWSPDGNWLYHADTHDEVIYRRSYRDGLTGERRPFIDVRGRPDGITTDSQGRLWVTVFDRGVVAVYDSKGNPLEQLSLPLADLHPASVEFIGTLLSEILIVTGYPRVQDEAQHRVEGDGGLFVASTAATGLLRTPWIEAPLPESL